MQERMTVQMPKPRKVGAAAIALVCVVWVYFAVTLNWAETSPDLLAALVGSDDILRGEVWRLFTNFVIHKPQGPGAAWHLLGTTLFLYFLGGALEESWGSKRYGIFLVASGVFASLLQVLVGALVPQLHASPFFGGLGVVDAAAIAWAMSFKDRTVNLFFVLPVSGKAFLIFIVGMNVLYLLSLENRNEGLVTPFAGMFAGWVGAEGSPVRRLFLQWRFKRLQAASTALRGVKTERAPHLRVVKGGRGGKPDKDLLN